MPDCLAKMHQIKVLLSADPAGEFTCSAPRAHDIAGVEEASCALPKNPTIALGLSSLDTTSSPDHRFSSLNFKVKLRLCIQTKHFCKLTVTLKTVTPPVIAMVSCS